MNFSGKFGSDQTIWYPASGYRCGNDGYLDNVWSIGYYWSASPYNSGAHSLGFKDDGYVFPSGKDTRSYGQSVRCLQVIDEVAEP